MKKIILFPIVLLFTLLVINTKTYAEEVIWEKDFFDDFESYQTGKIENNNSFKENWTNHYFSGSDNNSNDIIDVGTIKQEADNKFLNLNYDSSFFYVTPHNYRAKDFELTFDLRSSSFNQESWVGINFRKEYRDARYNGTRGFFITITASENKNESNDVIGEAYSVAIYRGGSLSETNLSDDIVGSRKIESTHDDPADEQLKNNWVKVKLEVESTDKKGEVVIKVSINDELLATLNHTRSALDTYGYISLNSVLGDFDIDNFKITAKDQTPPPPIIRLLEVLPSEGKVDEVFNLPKADKYELIGDSDDKVEIEILNPDTTTTKLEQDVYEFTPTKEGIYTIRFIAENSFGDKTVEEVMVRIIKDDIEEPTEPVDPVDPTEPDKPSKKTLSWVWISLGGLALLCTLLGIFVIIKKRNKI